MEQKLVKVPFEVELAKEISNGTKEGKVVTRDDGNARIICWDAEGDQPIIALIKYHDKEYPHSFCMNGLLQDGDFLNGDLILEIPEYMTFKDGDVLYVRLKNNNWYIFIYGCNSEHKTNSYTALGDNGRLWIEDNYITSNDFISELRFAAESEKQKLIEALKASKEPKAKEYLKRFFDIELKQGYEFKPFDKVLVRYEGCVWFADIFSHYKEDSDCEYKTAGGGSWEQCIPYNEQTAHLLGTTDNWEE